MRTEAELLARHGLATPDGRPLFAWNANAEERVRLARLLASTLDPGVTLPLTAARFVLWAAEEIRTHHQPGHLTWEWLFGRLGLPAHGALGRVLTESGLTWWRREVRLAQGGQRQFLYSLMAEGGLPDAYLAQAQRYRGAILAMLAEIEAADSLNAEAAQQVARRATAQLAQAFRHEDTVLLFAELALALARLRARLPPELPAIAIEGWLDRHSLGWRQSLPLRLSAEALEALVAPALRVARGAAARPAGPPCGRELRRMADGRSWAGYAVIGDGAGLAPNSNGWWAGRAAPAA